MLHCLSSLVAGVGNQRVAAQCCYILLQEQPCKATRSPAVVYAFQREQQQQHVSQPWFCQANRRQSRTAWWSTNIPKVQQEQSHLAATSSTGVACRLQHPQQGQLNLKHAMQQHRCGLRTAVFPRSQSGCFTNSWLQCDSQYRLAMQQTPAGVAAFSSVVHGLVHHPPPTSAGPLQEQQTDAAVPLAHPHVSQMHQHLQHEHPVARVLDGKTVAAEWSAELQQEVPAITQLLGRPPGLAVILVGNRPDSLLYVSKKEEACQRVGIHCRILRLQDSVSQQDLQEAVAAVAGDAAIDGVLVQLPLPRHMDEESVMGFLDPKKDVDGFHPLNMGRMLMRGRARRFVPATPLGVVELLSRSGVSLAGKTAVVVGDSNIVGTPLAALLRDEGVALVTTCHRPSIQDWFEEQEASNHVQRAQADVCLPRLPGPGPGPGVAAQQKGSSSSGIGSTGFQASQLPAICRTADILVVAVGSPELVKGDWVKPGAVVVDVGINVVPAAGHSDQALAAAAGAHKEQRAGDSRALCTLQQQGHHQHSSFQLAQGSMSEAEPALQQQHEQHACCQAGAAATQAGSSGTFTSVCAAGHYRVVGDVAAHEVAGVASDLTPVPGGVGPMTIAAVLHNTLQAARYTAGVLPW